MCKCRRLFGQGNGKCSFLAATLLSLLLAAVRRVFRLTRAVPIFLTPTHVRQSEATATAHEHWPSFVWCWIARDAPAVDVWWTPALSVAVYALAATGNLLLLHFVVVA